LAKRLKMRQLMRAARRKRKAPNIYYCHECWGLVTVKFARRSKKGYTYSIVIVSCGKCGKTKIWPHTPPYTKYDYYAWFIDDLVPVIYLRNVWRWRILKFLSPCILKELV